MAEVTAQTSIEHREREASMSGQALISNFFARPGTSSRAGAASTSRAGSSSRSGAAASTSSGRADTRRKHKKRAKSLKQDESGAFVLDSSSSSSSDDGSEDETAPASKRARTAQRSSSSADRPADDEKGDSELVQDEDEGMKEAVRRSKGKARSNDVSTRSVISAWRYDSSGSAPPFTPLASAADREKLRSKVLARAERKARATERAALNAATSTQGYVAPRDIRAPGEERRMFSNAIGGGVSSSAAASPYAAVGGAGDEEDEDMLEMLAEDEDADDDGAADDNAAGSMRSLASKFSMPGASTSSTAASSSKGKDSTKSSSKGKGKEASLSGAKYTPLEQQVVALKAAYPDVLLMIEVGYKLRFFGDDAQLASRALNIACFRSRHFMTASVPVHRLEIYVKRLIAAGHKVGVVRQTETAALKKAGDNRSAPFERKLTALYTSATYIEELGSDARDELEDAHTGTATIMCVVEQARGGGGGSEDHRVKLAFVSLCPSTGEVVYDEFEDTYMRTELETRLLHLQPTELLLQQGMSRPTESMIAYLSGHTGAGGFVCRRERIPKLSRPEKAVAFLSGFYTSREETRDGAQKSKGKAKQQEVVIDVDEDDDVPSSAAALKSALALPKLVIIALASLIEHLQAFSLALAFYHAPSFSHFASRATLSLNANTLVNLDVLQNQTDKTERGSLVWVLDRTKTPFGKRLLRKWITRPLLSKEAIDERLSAVTELVERANSPALIKLRAVLQGLPDLERGITRIHLGRASPDELVRVLQGFVKISTAFDDIEVDTALPQSALLRSIISELPAVKETATEFLAKLRPDKARQGCKEDLYSDTALFPGIQEQKDRVESARQDLTQELKSIRKELRKPALQFTTVAKEEYLIEVSVSESKSVPHSWTRINSTRSCHRYRTPAIESLMTKLAQYQELLGAEAQSAFKEFQKQVAEFYDDMRIVISAAAMGDCLLSLATVAQFPGYVRPDVQSSDEAFMDVKGARHPMVEQLLSDAFVPNDVSLGGEAERHMILLGPNAGGKSCLSRSVALIALMAQIGSYVPADSCSCSLFDGVYTRMGASDDIARGRSTFMLEMSETSEIIKLATPRSLVILDELGRGTSTMDGQAIAYAVLRTLAESIRCLSVFVTHYPSLSQVAEALPTELACFHMACVEGIAEDGFPEVTFLYQLKRGLATKSHGLNVARLAGLPTAVLRTAMEKGRMMDDIVEKRVAQKRDSTAASLVKTLLATNAGASPRELSEKAREALRVLTGVEL